MKTCRNAWCRNPVTRRGALCRVCRRDRNNALRRLKRGNDDPAGPLPARSFRNVLAAIVKAKDALDELERRRVAAEARGAPGVPFQDVDHEVQVARAALTDVLLRTARWQALDAVRGTYVQTTGSQSSRDSGTPPIA